MPRYRLTVEYDGTGYAGWQRQKNAPSIQAALEAAIRGFRGEETCVLGAGRTDAGVHARGQVCHVDLACPVDPSVLRDAVNAHLRPAPVAIVTAAEAADEFHARFSATRRVYRYRIVNRRAPLALDSGRAWRVSAPLDRAAMARAAARLLGRHDFTSFRAAACQAASPMRTLDRLEIASAGESVFVSAAARSFLHNQVRILVGTLVDVGRGRRRPAEMAAVLAARDRAAAGPTAPAAGLCLMEVGYE